MAFASAMGRKTGAPCPATATARTASVNPSEPGTPTAKTASISLRSIARATSATLSETRLTDAGGNVILSKRRIQKKLIVRFSGWQGLQNANPDARADHQSHAGRSVPARTKRQRSGA